MFVLGLFSMMSCSNSSTDDLIDPIDTTNITYTGNIKTIIDTNCVNCHGNPLQNNAPFPITTYDELVTAINTTPVISRMTNASNPMPPSGVLPSTTVALINQWIMNDFPE